MKPVFAYRPLALAIAGMLLSSYCLADTSTPLDAILVNDNAMGESESLSGEQLATQRARTSDSAMLLTDLMGVSVINAGGVSSQPVLNGLGDDRVKIDIDGVTTTSACANHMNPPMSYVDPANVNKVTVYSGGTVPVSVGGDSIAGTIKVESVPPKFTAVGEKSITSGSVTAFSRSNGNGIGGSANVSYSDDSTNLTYTKTYSHSNNYQAASSFKAGDGKITNTVGTSLYEMQTDKLVLAKKVGVDLYTFTVAHQYIPYQGFPSQYMDMTNNESFLFNAAYLGEFNWGLLDARVFNQNVSHSMNFIDTKYSAANPQGMPMNTSGKDQGYVVKGIIPLSGGKTLTVGNEYHHQELNDWWPASGNMMMAGMNPYSYWNINDGWRNRLGTFAELETKHNSQWTSLIGLRHELVTTGTGNVVGYYGTLDGARAPATMGETTPNLAAADAFNAQNHNRTDNNIDFTAAAKYLANDTSDYEFGYARKTRSANLYELYTWGKTAMDMKMIGWDGSGNGYIGNLNLKPEVANTLSITGNWHDADREDWQVKAMPYVSYVENYIDANICGSLAAGAKANANLCAVNSGSNVAGSGSVIGLQYANHNAMLYGVDVSAKKALGQFTSGNYTLAAMVNYTRGTILDTDATHPSSNIYNIMPFTTKIALQHRLGKWNNAVEVQYVASKTAVDTDVNEFKTPDYTLLNLRTGYDWGTYRVDAGVDNLLDTMYYLPTAGAMLAPSVQGGGKAPYGAVPGMGRSLYVAGTLRF
jgi:iron complex outermembrane receptor protein